MRLLYALGAGRQSFGCLGRALELIIFARAFGCHVRLALHWVAELARMSMWAAFHSVAHGRGARELPNDAARTCEDA